MISNNLIKFKVSENYDALETNKQEVDVYFPFINEKSTFSRYRAQLFYANNTYISDISIAVAKGNDFPSYDLPIGIYKYENNASTNYGIDNPSNAIVTYNSRSIYIASESISSYEEDGSHVPMTTISGLNSLITGLTKGSAYWLVLDCGSVYDSTLETNRTHDFYFTMTTENWSAVGTDSVDGSSNYYVSNSQSSIINTAPLRSDIVSWNWSDNPRDHVFKINGLSPAQVAFSLDGSLWSGYVDLYSEALDWQKLGYTSVNITNSAIGGNSTFGSKNLYTRFSRPSASGSYDKYSVYLTSDILYTPGIPVVNEILLAYIGTV